MKKKFLVVLLVLSFVLVGCGQKDYTDVGLYKDMLVQKYKEIDEDFFKMYNEALSKTGIKKSMDNVIDSSLEFIDNSLDLLGDEAEKFYNNFEVSVEKINTLPFTQEDINKFVDEFEALSDKRKEQVTNLANGVLDKTASQINKATDYVKDLSAEQIQKLKDGVKELSDKSGKVFKSLYEYVNKQLGN